MLPIGKIESQCRSITAGTDVGCGAPQWAPRPADYALESRRGWRYERV